MSSSGALASSMLPGRDQRRCTKMCWMCESGSMCSFKLEIFREVGWRLQERRCLEGTRGRHSFLTCTRQANKHFAAANCDIHILLAAFWACLGTLLAIQRRERRFKQICIAWYFLDRIACLYKTTRATPKRFGTLGLLQASNDLGSS